MIEYLIELIKKDLELLEKKPRRIAVYNGPPWAKKAICDELNRLGYIASVSEKPRGYSVDLAGLARTYKISIPQKAPDSHCSPFINDSGKVIYASPENP